MSKGSSAVDSLNQEAGFAMWSIGSRFLDTSEPNGQRFFVYRHTCLLNGKSYIGYSAYPNKRWKQHIECSSRESCPEFGYPFKRAIRKHGENYFSHEILAVVSSESVAKYVERLEIMASGSFSSGYNATMGGDGASRAPVLTEEFILERAQEHFRIWNRWPTVSSGRVIGGNPGDTWRGYDAALRDSTRGLRSKTTLARLLDRHTAYVAHKSRLSTAKLEQRISAHFKLTCSWPSARSGSVIGGEEGDTWSGYNQCLRLGYRGFKKGSSLASFLEERFGVINQKRRPQLTIEFIKTRMTEYFIKTGRYPHAALKCVDGGHKGDTWGAYDAALRHGARGLPGGSSLTLLKVELAETR